MSDSPNNQEQIPDSGPPSVQAALARRAPGVRDARQAPTARSTLQTGDLVGGRFVVSRLLGSSDGAISYLCQDRKNSVEVVIKVLDLPRMTPEIQQKLSNDVRRAASFKHRQLSGLVGMGQTDHGQLFVAMEYIDGASLSRLVATRRETNTKISMRDVFTIIAHLCNVLGAVHQHGMAHGVVTPYNVMVTRQGVLKLANLAFGSSTASVLALDGKGPIVDSIYVSPELHKNPNALSPAADIYSVGMLAVELLSIQGLPANREMASAAVSEALMGYPPQLTQLLLGTLDSEPSRRPSLAHIRQAFEESVRDMGTLLGMPPGPDELPIEPAVEPEEERNDEDDLFDMPELSNLGQGLGFDDDEDEGRYLVQINGLDYGPFPSEKILAQLHKDEINEHSLVLDRVTQERIPLGEMDVFRAEVQKYIPIRQERLRQEAEARAKLQAQVKKGGVAVFVVGIAAGAVTLIVMMIIIALQPDPKPLPMESAFAAMDYKILPPPKDFKEVAVDKEFMNSLFNPQASEEEIQKQIRKRLKKRRRKGPGRKNGPGDVNETEVDLMATSKNKTVLTDNMVADVIISKFGSLRRCVMKELRSDPGFKGVTVQFYVRPSGTTGGVKIKPGKYGSKPVGSCLKSRFRAMKFPAHGGFNKGVVYPLRIQ